MARFLSFTSGSCGNCYYLEGPSGKAVLIDAGVSVRKMKTVLEQYGIGLDRIAGVLVTHEHLDHIRHLGAYCKRLSLPVWATDRQHVILSTHFATAEHIAPCRRVLAKGKWNEVAPGISARYFQVSHDAGDTVGYAITLGDHRFVLMTDLGSVPKEAMEFSRQADTVVIESNYDIDMLLGGSYPPELKQRIFRDAGHLSNDDCAAAIHSFWHPGLRNIFLCHLSAENNTPTLAYNTASAALGAVSGVSSSDVPTTSLRILPRGIPTPLLIL